MIKLLRPLYILWRTGLDVSSIPSRFINAVLLFGSTAQTTSSHAHINPKLKYLRKTINALVFWQEDHCAESWKAEVERAIHTLAVHMKVRDEDLVITVKLPLLKEESL